MSLREALDAMTDTLLREALGPDYTLLEVWSDEARAAALAVRRGEPSPSDKYRPQGGPKKPVPPAPEPAPAPAPTKSTAPARPAPPDQARARRASLSRYRRNWTRGPRRPAYTGDLGRVKALLR